MFQVHPTARWSTAWPGSEAVAREGMEAFLVVQKVDCYYVSGTTQDGLLLVPLEGEPLLLVRREVERARVESPLEEVVGRGPLREHSSLMCDHAFPVGAAPQRLGLELDVLPVRDYFRYQDLFPGVRFMDASPVIKDRAGSNLLLRLSS